MDLWIILFFAVLFPAYSAHSYPKVKAVLAQNIPGLRLKVYAEAMFWLWLMTAIAASAWFYQGRDTAQLGLQFGGAPAWFGLLLVLTLATYLWYDAGKIRHNTGLQNKARARMARVKELLPTNTVELKRFFFVSLTAGICEEILYRAYLFWFLQQHLPLEAALIFASILFGLGHSYQGLKACVQTMFLGLGLGLLFVYSGSLLPCILVHFIIDAHAGYVARMVLDPAKIQAEHQS